MSDTPNSSAYQVLARKYRPGHFRDLIGQEAMVKTLTNAFAHDRIAHAFILTGVRGVGKTTTARIIAKGLNCTGRQTENGGDGPTIDPCGECEACISIAEGRNVDVLEMDAASNTGVGDVREIIDSVRYRAASARYKVYIIDEVHMLSTSAFNALLKTLEEPPEHVKFVFATTEIRKVPVTVLSRCQRFDLRRIEPEAMLAYLHGITRSENAAMEDDALGLIVRAAEGSVRDALSLLDQALAHGGSSTGVAETGATSLGNGPTAAEVRAMLGLADRGRVIDLFEAIMGGDAKAALEELGTQYADGADPAVVLRDLAELTHWISVLKISAEAAEDPTVSAAERARGNDLAGRLSMRVLTRAWQMLLKAIEEVPIAPTAMMAAEMAVIRLTHVANLPPPEELVRRLTEAGPAGGGASRPSGGGSDGGPAARLTAVAGGAEVAAAPAAEPGAELQAYARFEDVMALLRAERDIKLLTEVESYVRLVRYKPGIIEFNPAAGAPAELAGRLSQRLRGLTGARWSVLVSGEEGRPTAAEEAAAEQAAETARAAGHPLVLAALEAFPGAEIRAVRPLGGGAPEEILAPAPEREFVEIEGDLVDSDDPFEEEI